MTPVTGKPLRIVFDSLTETLTVYALAADLIAFTLIIIAGITRLLPASYTAALLIAWLLMTLLAVIYTLWRVVGGSNESISVLARENQQLQGKLGTRVDRRALLEARLKNKLNEDRSGSIDEFIHFLETNIFPFLVREFEFKRVALVEVGANSLSVFPQVRACFPANSAEKSVDHDIRNRFDQSRAEEVIKKGDTSRPVEMSYENNITYFLAVLPRNLLADQVAAGCWYVFVFHLKGLYQSESASQEADYIKRELATELKNTFKRFHERIQLLDLSQHINYTHLCAILYVAPGGRIAIENVSSFNSDELSRIEKILQQEDSQECLRQAFSHMPSSTQSPIVPIFISSRLYNLSFVPVFSSGFVYRVILFLDEADRHALASDQTRWQTIYELANYLHSGPVIDSVTGLVNKWYFEQWLEALLAEQERDQLLGLFFIGLTEVYPWNSFSKEAFDLLRDVAQIVKEWAFQDVDQIHVRSSLAAKYETGIFLMAKRIPSRDNAEEQARGIRRQIERSCKRKDYPSSATIGVALVNSNSLESSEGDSDAVRTTPDDFREHFMIIAGQLLKSAMESDTGIAVERLW